MLTRQLVLLRGLPGSGKSTVAHAKDGATVLSTDDFFITADGTYQWSNGALGKAHVWNQERCRLALEKGTQLVVIDNCNITCVDAVPYVTMGVALGYEVTIEDVHSTLDASELVARNVHTVSKETIEQMRNS
jgi:predicted kinase